MNGNGSRRTAEDLRTFFALVEHAGDFIGVAELDGRFRYINPAGLGMIGAQRLDDVRVLSLGDFISGAGRDLFARGEQQLPGQELRAETKLRNLATGDELEVEVNAFVIRDPETGEPEAVGIVQRDIGERKRAWAELERSNDERRRLLAGLVSAQEEERERIAADVHDDSIQVMTGAAIRLQMLAEEIEDAAQRDQLDKLDQSVRASIASLRQLIFELRPPALDAHGVGPAVDSYLSHTVSSEGIEYRLRDEIREQPPPDLRTILYRVAQEAISNVRRHAQASRIDVLLENRDGGWMVRVEDDGVGFEATGVSLERPGHLGLIGMRERVETSGGRIEIVSRPGSGTSVEFWLPAPAGAAT